MANERGWFRSKSIFGVGHFFLTFVRFHTSCIEYKYNIRQQQQQQQRQFCRIFFLSLRLLIVVCACVSSRSSLRYSWRVLFSFASLSWFTCFGGQVFALRFIKYVYGIVNDNNFSHFIFNDQWATYLWVHINKRAKKHLAEFHWYGFSWTTIWTKITKNELGIWSVRFFCRDKKMGNYNRKQKCIYRISVEGMNYNRIFIFGCRFVRSLFSVGVVMWKMIDFSTWLENVYAFEKYALFPSLLLFVSSIAMCVIVFQSELLAAVVWDPLLSYVSMYISFVLGLRVINPSFFEV